MARPIKSRQLLGPKQQQHEQTVVLFVCFRCSSSDEEARPVSPVAVRRVKPVDALADAKVERLLQLRVHAVVVAPDQLVPPRPRAEACGEWTGGAVVDIRYVGTSEYEYDENEYKPKSHQQQKQKRLPAATRAQVPGCVRADEQRWSDEAGRID